MMNRAHFTDFSIAAEQYSIEENYWMQKLSGEPVKSSFPCDFNNFNKVNPAQSNHSSSQVPVEIPGVLAAKALQLINGSDYRLHMVFMAVTALLLARYTGNTDIILGAPVYKQSSQGKFINTTLALRNQVRDDLTFKELLISVKETVTEASKNQNYPIETILYKLNIPLPKEGDDFPLFDVAVLLENIHDRQYIGHINLNMVFSFLRAESKISGILEYNPLLYAGSTAGRVIRQFIHILEQVLFNIDIPLACVDILTEEEKRQLQVEFNCNALPYPVDKTLPQCFEELAEKTPDRIALVGQITRCGEQGGKDGLAPSALNHVLSYRELNKQSNQLARLLRQKGVQPDTIVGIMTQRTIEMIIGIMAILKAGGAYLPIDAEYPKKRLRYMLDNCDISILLTTSGVITGQSFTGLQELGAGKAKLVITAPRLPIPDLDILPMPDRSLVDYDKYSRKISLAMVKNCISLQGTRGCPYNCAYCAKLWSKKHVVRSAEHLFAEVMHYYNMGIRRFSIIDDIFNLEVENSKRFFQLIIDNGLEIQILFPAGLRGDIMTEDYIDLMVKAGTINISVALETASPRLQKLVKKNLNVPRLKENLQYICEKHPQVILDLFTMHGFPTETEADALETLEFIKSLKWLHFPLINILKIYPDTDMEKLAIESGISRETLLESMDLAWHELSETLPFDRNFTIQYQAEFLNEYFLLKERLLDVLPYQMKVLTEDELVQKYNSYLPQEITNFQELLKFLGISREELRDEKGVLGGCAAEERFAVYGLGEKIRQGAPVKKPDGDAFRVLLLDLSQSFSSSNQLLDELVEPPLGLMYLLTWLNQGLGSKVRGKIAKSGVDFDNYEELKELLLEFKPRVIGIRTLTFYKDFFHQTVSFIRQWGIDVPVVAGGPYATNAYMTLLQDRHLDLVVLSEGELTFTEVVEAIMSNDGKLPGQEILNRIQGIAYVPEAGAAGVKGFAREVILMDQGPIFGMSYPGRLSGENLTHVNQSTDLAYVIYTSGSTGKPKGVMIEHRGVNNLVAGLNERVYKRYGRSLHVGLLAPYVFDASVKQVFAALLLGHALYMIPEETRLDGESLIAFYKWEGIDIVDGTPAYLQVLVESMAGKSLDLDNKHYLIGGEELSAPLVQRFLKACAGAKRIPGLTNVYGPTECTVDAACFEVSVDHIAPGETMSIGKPMPNVSIYITDRKNRLQPLGAAGELCIGGTGVGRGYINRPELTAERFINKKFLRKMAGPGGGTTRFLDKSPPGRRRQNIYKTGDKARWLINGNLEYIGRMDQQVKIRGYRIELEGIENQLLSYPGIKEAVVVTWQMKSSEQDRYICVYIVPQQDRSVEVVHLKKYLSRQLPDFMMPWKFVLLEKLPLTPNGKVDKKALPLPAEGEGESYRAPVNRTQKKLVEIWSELLGIDGERIGIDADFFDMGGHSLKAVILVSRVHKELGVKIPLTEIFRTPVIRELSAYIIENEEEPFSPIEPVEKREYYELSSAQRRLYILQQMDMQSTSYNKPTLMQMQGKLDPDRLEGAFRALFQRHESFCTSFNVINDEPVQVIHDKVEFKIENFESGREADGQRTVVNNFLRPFDLSKAPLVRVGLIKIGEDQDKHILMVDLHHITSDGLSMEVVVNELMLLLAGKELSILRLQYKDFSCWQNSEKNREVIKRQQYYWKKELGGEIPVLNMPLDFPRPALQDFAGDRVFFEFNREQTGRLKALAKNQEATLYILMLAVFYVLLSKLSGQEDIVIGAPVVGRRHADLVRVVGMFVNILALRNYPVGAKTFEDFLEEVNQGAVQGFDNQDYQFESLLEDLELKRDMSRNPLFDVSFALQKFDIPGLQIPGLVLRPYEYENLTAKFDLNLVGSEEGEILRFSLEYCTKLFKPGTIARFVEYFRCITRVILENPGKKIGEIGILSEEERQQILKDFNDKAADYPRHKTIHELFREQVQKSPDHIALFSRILYKDKTKKGIGGRVPGFDFQSVSYRQLNLQSDRLASLLGQKGVMPDTIVGIMAEKSVETIIGILGILKSGGAYLPIDPDYPGEHIDYILNDSSSRIALTEEEIIEATDPIQTVIHADPLTQFPFIQPDHLAYIIYTSGTTGRPKGTMIRHGNVVRLMFNDKFQFDFGSSDTWTMFHSYCFDFSVWEMYGALLYGGKLVIIPKMISKDPQQYLEILEKDRVTVLNQTPSVFYNLVNEIFSPANGERKLYLKYVIFGGEALKPLKLKTWKEKYPHIKLINMFGITETTVHVTYKQIGDKEIRHNISNIGKPIPTLGVYVVDKELHLVPVGVAGELCVGGDGLGRGYLNRPALTKEKFVYNPYRQGNRLYKSGDLARFMENGDLEYLGRIDNQVKIRGFRIELGEIENRLLRFAPIKEAVLIDSEDNYGEKELLAYIVPDSQYAYPVAQLLKLESSVKHYHHQYECSAEMAVFYINRNETDFMYREIFEEQSYLKHGITLNDGDCILDVGANIGLFSLFVHRKCRNTKIYSFEPLPPIHEILSLNMSLYGVDANIYACGLFSEQGEAEFTYYPYNTVLSGRFADTGEEIKTVRAFIDNQQSVDSIGDAVTGDQVNEMLADRLTAKRFTCPLKTLSAIINENNIERIDLLKIDVEKSELEVLTGINGKDWPKIRQIVMEVHNIDNRLEKIIKILENNGFNVTTEQDNILKNTDLINIYALRPAVGKTPAGNNIQETGEGNPDCRWSSPESLKAGARTFLREQLPYYMIPSTFILIENLPLNLNGKVDRRALPAPRLTQGTGYAKPTDGLEAKLVRIWADVLGVPGETIGIYDDFFEKGGHSLKAALLASRVSKAFNVEFRITDVFTGPTVSDFGARIRNAQKGLYEEIRPVEKQEYYSQSSAQKRIFFLEQFENIGYSCHIVSVLRVKGQLDLGQFNGAIRQLTQQHEPLRTSFRLIQDEPVQIVHDGADLEIRVFPQDAVHKTGAEKVIKSFIKPFDLTRAPLLRVGLAASGKDEYLLMYDLHHIIGDGTSLGILMTDFIRAYSGETLSPLPIQYKDFAPWQQNLVTTGRIKTQEEYWLNRFSGEIPCLDFPTDFPRPTIPTFEGGSFEFHLERETALKFKAIGMEIGATLFMNLLAVYHVLLHKYTGKTDIIVGTAMMGRSHAHLHHITGMFINMLGMRNLLSPGETYLEFLKKVKESTLQAFENQDVQFEELVDRLKLDRNPSRNPLFDVEFNLNNFERAVIDNYSPGGIDFLPYRYESRASKFDMALIATELEDEISFSFKYSTSLFREETIKEIARHFIEVVDQVSENPDVFIGEITLSHHLGLLTTHKVEEDLTDFEL